MADVEAVIDNQLARLTTFSELARDAVEAIDNARGYGIPEPDYVNVDKIRFDAELEKPTQEELDSVRKMTDLPLRLIRACGEWYAIRALKWSELKSIRTKATEGIDADYEVKILQKTILIGPKNFDELPAGIVPFLYTHLKQISGLDMEGPDVFSTEAEDL